MLTCPRPASPPPPVPLPLSSPPAPRYEQKLGTEKEASLRLKGENGIMRKKFNALQKDIEAQKEEIKNLFEQVGAGVGAGVPCPLMCLLRLPRCLHCTPLCDAHREPSGGIGSSCAWRPSSPTTPTLPELPAVPPGSVVVTAMSMVTDVSTPSRCYLPLSPPPP